jgi:hypothetical protein
MVPFGKVGGWIVFLASALVVYGAVRSKIG